MLRERCCRVTGRCYTHLSHVRPHSLRVGLGLIQGRHKTRRVAVRADLVQCDALGNNVTKDTVSSEHTPSL